MSDLSVFGAEVPYILGYAVLLTLLVQFLKGRAPADGEVDPAWFTRFQSAVRPVLPWAVAVLGSLVGTLLALSMGRPLLAGLVEGLTGAAVSMGFYDVGSVTPGVKRVLNKRGWA